MAIDYSLDLRRAMKRKGLSLAKLADATRMSPETLKGILYRDRLTSLPSVYEIARVTGEVRMPGPHGTLVMRIEDDRTPPPAAPAVAVPIPRRDAA